MIIDIHAHVCAAPELYQWKANQMSARGAHGSAPKKFTDEWVRDHPDTKRNLRVMDTVGTDVQFLSPRPFQLMHAEKPVKIMESWAIANHDYIAQQVKAFPNRFQGVCAIPQAPGAPITLGFPEIDRCVKDLGFIGLLDRHRSRGRRQQHAHARRRILVSAVGKDGAAGPPRSHSFDRLQARTRKLQPAFHHRRKPRDTLHRQFERAAGFPEAEDHRFARRRVDSLPDWALAGRLRTQRRRHGGRIQSPSRACCTSIRACTRASRSSCFWASRAAST